jgi:hypothetical protein
MMDDPMQVRAMILKEHPEVAVLPLNMAAILYNKDIPYQWQQFPSGERYFYVAQTIRFGVGRTSKGNGQFDGMGCNSRPNHSLFS